jgi:hypothetical protein
MEREAEAQRRGAVMRRSDLGNTCPRRTRRLERGAADGVGVASDDGEDC